MQSLKTPCLWNATCFWLHFDCTCFFFKVHHELKNSDERRLPGAHLLGRDDLPVAGEVRRDKDLVKCAPAESSATALCLEVEAGAMGRLMLQTCLLKQRDEPYLLFWN